MQGFGGQTYNWIGPQNQMFGGQTATFVASSINYSGTYTLIATDTNNCKNKTILDLEIYNLPGGSLNPDKQEDCIPFYANFKSSVTSKNVLSQWILENKTYTTTSFSHPFLNAGTYTITGNFRDTLTTCVSSSSFVIRANLLPMRTSAIFRKNQ